jgi:hypothetical protein
MKSRRRVLEKEGGKVTKLVMMKFPIIYGTRRFITLFTTARRWTLS